MIRIDRKVVYVTGKGNFHHLNNGLYIFIPFVALKYSELIYKFNTFVN